jgi:predicted tellurium resistance membrane protein TerC
MRLVAGQLIVLVQRYPALVDGAFVIIAWVGLKLCLEYLHDAHYTDVEIPRWASLGLIAVIFVIAFIYAKLQGPVEEVDPLAGRAEAVLDEHSG